jgi:CRP/FNR family transcriptional regulator
MNGPSTIITDFLQQHPTRKYDSGQAILMQGEVSHNLYAIKSGFVKGYDISKDGMEQLVWFGAPSHILPLPWAFSLEQVNPFFFAALTDVELYVVNLGEFLDFLETSPEASFEMNRRMARWYFDLLQRLQAAEKPKASEKLVYTLGFLSERFSRRVGKARVEVNVPLTHQDLANLVGLTRETITIELRKLKKQGYIDYSKSHFIIYPDKLDELR